MHLIRHRWSRLARNAWSNRQELVAAGMATRRDLLKLGLLGGTGLLLAKHGLSSRAADGGKMASPATRPWVDELPIMPVKRPLPGGAKDLNPYPSIAPNHAGGEGRMRAHQAFTYFGTRFTWPPSTVYRIRQTLAPVFVSPDLPRQQVLWGFDGITPGPTYHAKLGEQVLVRNTNELPLDNRGFGNRGVSTHLHNGHVPSESDGFPGDYFPNPEIPAIRNASFYDQHYPNLPAGFSSGYLPDGDPNEAMASLWYHDHRSGFTAQNVYKGLAGFYLVYSDFDCGDEYNMKGFRLPGVRDANDFYAPVKYDVPLMLTDKVFDPVSGQAFFDLFNFDGILGDKFIVNGKVQPFMNVEPRRYRFRILNSGPSRFYHLFLTDSGANTAIPFWQVSNDGNLMPRPIKVRGTPMSVAERMDVVVDFKPWAGKTLYLENRWLQTDGRGPERNIGEAGALAAPGQGNLLLQFRVGTAQVADNSIDFETTPGVRFYDLPSRGQPRVSRSFKIERGNNLWMVNGKAFPDDASTVNFRIRRNSAEQWTFINKSGGWMHPMHAHLEEFQLIRRNGRAIGPNDVEYARKDMLNLQHNEENIVAFRFQDFSGRYPLHCHNVLHEDHAMMMRFDIDDVGDTRTTP
jgi:FtsP/CotA-like multicopper oxidase with cupredoxin domain